jgi:hypothetical protein
MRPAGVLGPFDFLPLAREAATRWVEDCFFAGWSGSIVAALLGFEGGRVTVAVEGERGGFLYSDYTGEGARLLSCKVLQANDGKGFSRLKILKLTGP